jgi:hypothetical protein
VAPGNGFKSRHDHIKPCKVIRQSRHNREFHVRYGEKVREQGLNRGIIDRDDDENRNGRMTDHALALP